MFYSSEIYFYPKIKDGKDKKKPLSSNRIKGADGNEN